MTGVTISWNLQVVQDSERTPETPGKTRRRSTPGVAPRTRALPRRSAPMPPPPRVPRTTRAPEHSRPRTYFGTPRTTREVPRNSATTLSSQYKVTSVIPLRP